MANDLTVYEHLRHAGASLPDHEFIHVPAIACREYSTGPIRLSYREAYRRAEELAELYRLTGYGAGHRVALALDNRADFFLHFLALNALGASIVPLNAAMSRPEIAFIIEHADVGAVVTHAGHAAHLRACAPEQIPIAVVNAAGAPERLGAPARDPGAKPAEAALLYTSGTTGRPKGCILSNAYFTGLGRLYRELGGYCALQPGRDRLITPLPVSHVNALGCSFMAMLMTGGCLIQLDRFHPSTWWQSVRESGATGFHYLGVMPAMLLRAPPSVRHDVSARVRFGFGAGVDPRHQAEFERRFGVPLIEAWCMTETGSGAWITANEPPRHVGQRCFGRAPPGLQWRLIDESGAAVEPGAPGELLVRQTGRGPRCGFFDGYYKDAAATAEVWADGWFHTGDVIRVNTVGSFFFVDRLKNVIRRSGENIAAVEVESVLLQQELVESCAVAPVSDEMRGEEVFALVVPRANIPASQAVAEALQAACLEALAYFKAPGYVIFVDSLPQTASQKLARAEIKRLAATLVGTANVFDLRARKTRTGHR